MLENQNIPFKMTSITVGFKKSKELQESRTGWSAQRHALFHLNFELKGYTLHKYIIPCISFHSFFLAQREQPADFKKVLKTRYDTSSMMWTQHFYPVSLSRFCMTLC